MKRITLLLLAAGAALLWWRARNKPPEQRARVPIRPAFDSAERVVVVPTEPPNLEPPDPEPPESARDFGFQIEPAERGAAQLGGRQRWLGFGAVALVAFLAAVLFSASRNRIPVTPDYVTVSADAGTDTHVLDGARASRAPALFRSYGCVSCHVVPGVPGAYGHVGPNLGNLNDHALIAGVLENTPANLVRWIRLPQVVDPRTGMPNLGVTEQDARDLAAYLYTLGKGGP